MLLTEYSLKIRATLTAIGVFFVSFAIACMRFSRFGTDPFVTMNIGLSKYLGIDFGFVQMVSNVFLVLLMLKFARNLIHLGTVLGIFVVGYLSDFLLTVVVRLPDQLIFRIFALCIGLVCCCFGVALYMSTNLGISSYDALGLILGQEILKHRKYKEIRVYTDVCCVTMGFVFGAPIGIGTLITAFFTGPLIDLFMKCINHFFLRREEKLPLGS